MGSVSRAAAAPCKPLPPRNVRIVAKSTPGRERLRRLFIARRPPGKPNRMPLGTRRSEDCARCRLNWTYAGCVAVAGKADAVERLAHARIAGLMMVGVFVYIPRSMGPGTDESAPRGEHGGHHREVLVVVFAHTVAAEEMQGG